MRKVLLCVWLEKLSTLFKQKILISACLLGKRVRFDGNIKSYNIELLQNLELVPCCPEVDGGLSTPRFPSELQIDGSVLNSESVNVTNEFNKGAINALKLADVHEVKVAILKSKSPSCSNRLIYDGSFTGNLIKGVGVTVKLLEENGIRVFDENQIEDALEFLSKL